MDPVQKAVATQIANIEKKTGKSLAELIKIVKSSGLAKHGEIRDMLKDEARPRPRRRQHPHAHGPRPRPHPRRRPCDAGQW